MATCAYCNSPLTEGLKFCPNCGAPVPIEAEPYMQPDAYNEQPYQDSSYQQSYQQPGYQQPQIGYGAPPAFNDSGSIGWGVLGFFFPIVGLILFLVWRNTRPNSAKVAGIGAIIGFVLGMMVNIGTLGTMM